MEDSKNFNINIYKENKEGIENASNRAEAYIIFANEELNNKNRELIQENGTLQNQIDNHIEENERMEVTITNQRGMLHNLHGLNKLEKSLKSQYESVNKDFIKQINEFSKMNQKRNDSIYKYGMYFVLILLCQTVFGFMDSSVFVMTIVSFISTLYFTLKLHGEKISNNSIIDIHNSFREAKNTEINKIINEIKEIQRSTDHISDFIDSL